MTKKIELMKKLEANGLSFTANVILTGCGKPVTKMKTLSDLIDRGYEIRPAQFETTQVVITGMGQCVAVWLGALDKGADAVIEMVK